MLNERKKKILQIIIEEYIASAEPVGSRALSKKPELGLSSATIRNEMSDLEEMGYLQQPHTSAGRVPSSLGYRLYVDSMLSPEKITFQDRALIEGWFHLKAKKLDEVFRTTAKVLSRMSKNISFVRTQLEKSLEFKYIKFLSMDDNRVIMALVTETGIAENSVFELPEGINIEDLDRIAQAINNHFSGYLVSDIKIDELEELSKATIDNTFMSRYLLDALHAVKNKNNIDKVFLGGATNLFDQPEFKDVEKIKDLLIMLEEEGFVKDMVTVGEQTGLEITIGSENKFTGIQDCSMVKATYRLNGQILGTFAVLGPTRMEYNKVISVMDYLHKYLRVFLANSTNK